MTTKTDFLQQGTVVFSCGLDNRDAVKGYHKEIPVEQTSIPSQLRTSAQPAPIIQTGPERE